MNENTCYQCGSEMIELPPRKYHYIESGLKDIYLNGITQYKCVECDETYVSIPRINGLHLAIGKSLCCKKGLLTGCEIKFLRKELHLQSKEFAKVLGITAQHLSRLENNEKVTSPTLDKLIRTIYILSVSSKTNNAICDNPAETLSKVSDKTVQQKDKHIDLNPHDWLTENSRLVCPA